MIGLDLSTKNTAMSEVIIMLIKMSIHPLLAFLSFLYDSLDPLSRILCPNFILFKVGISTGTNTNVISSAIIANKKHNFLLLTKIQNLYTSFSLYYFNNMTNTSHHYLDVFYVAM